MIKLDLNFENKEFIDKNIMDIIHSLENIFIENIGNKIKFNPYITEKYIYLDINPNNNSLLPYTLFYINYNLYNYNCEIKYNYYSNSIGGSELVSNQVLKIESNNKEDFTNKFIDFLIDNFNNNYYWKDSIYKCLINSN